MAARYDDDTRFLSGGVVVDWMRCEHGRVRVFATSKTIESWGLDVSDRRKIRAEFNRRKRCHIPLAVDAAAQKTGWFAVYEIRDTQVS